MNIPVWVNDWEGIKDPIHVGDVVDWTLRGDAGSPPLDTALTPIVRACDNDTVEIVGRCWVPSQVRAPFFVVNARDFHVGILLGTGVPSPRRMVCWRGKLWRWNLHDVDILPLLGHVQTMAWHPLYIVKEWREPRMKPARGTRRHVIVDYQSEGIPVTSSHDPRFINADGAFCCTIEIDA